MDWDFPFFHCSGVALIRLLLRPLRLQLRLRLIRCAISKILFSAVSLIDKFSLNELWATMSSRMPTRSSAMCTAFEMILLKRARLAGLPFSRFASALCAISTSQCNVHDPRDLQPGQARSGQSSRSICVVVTSDFQRL